MHIYIAFEKGEEMRLDIEAEDGDLIRFKVAKKD